MIYTNLTQPHNACLDTCNASIQQIKSSLHYKRSQMRKGGTTSQSSLEVKEAERYYYSAIAKQIRDKGTSNIDRRKVKKIPNSKSYQLASILVSNFLNQNEMNRTLKVAEIETNGIIKMEKRQILLGKELGINDKYDAFPQVIANMRPRLKPCKIEDFIDPSPVHSFSNELALETILKCTKKKENRFSKTVFTISEKNEPSPHKHHHKHHHTRAHVHTQNRTIDSIEKKQEVDRKSRISELMDDSTPLFGVPKPKPIQKQIPTQDQTHTDTYASLITPPEKQVNKQSMHTSYRKRVRTHHHRHHRGEEGQTSVRGEVVKKVKSPNRPAEPLYVDMGSGIDPAEYERLRANARTYRKGEHIPAKFQLRINRLLESSAPKFSRGVDPDGLRSATIRDTHIKLTNGINGELVVRFQPPEAAMAESKVPSMAQMLTVVLQKLRAMSAAEAQEALKDPTISTALLLAQQQQDFIDPNPQKPPPAPALRLPPPIPEDTYSYYEEEEEEEDAKPVVDYLPREPSEKIPAYAPPPADSSSSANAASSKAPSNLSGVEAHPEPHSEAHSETEEEEEEEEEEEDSSHSSSDSEPNAAAKDGIPFLLPPPPDNESAAEANPILFHVSPAKEEEEVIEVVEEEDEEEEVEEEEEVIEEEEVYETDDS